VQSFRVRSFTCNSSDDFLELGVYESVNSVDVILEGARHARFEFSNRSGVFEYRNRSTVFGGYGSRLTGTAD
jgi:hypothetical protein